MLKKVLSEIALYTDTVHVIEIDRKKIKNDILDSFNNLRIFTNSKVIKIYSKGNKIDYVEVKNKKDNSIKKIKCNKLILACGATQTPFLLNKSFLLKTNQLNQLRDYTGVHHKSPLFGVPTCTP